MKAGYSEPNREPRRAQLNLGRRQTHVRIVVTANKPTWVNRLGPKRTRGNDCGTNPQSGLGDLPPSTQAHPFSTPANSETLRSTLNRVQERSNFNRLSTASAQRSRCQPDAGCKWDCPRSECPG